MKIVTVLPCAKQSQYWVDFYIVGKHNSGPDDSFQIDVLLLLRPNAAGMKVQNSVTVGDSMNIKQPSLRCKLVTERTPNSGD